jgi:hypothetical protein
MRLREAEDAMAVGAAEISKNHQPRDLLGIRRGQSDGNESARDKRFEDSRLKTNCR